MTVLADAAGHAPPGMLLEFGVASGTTLRTLAAHRPGQTYGFDSFDGLPETWRPGFNRGMFRCPQPDVPGATILPGLFTDTLPEWIAQHGTQQVALVHIDCDLYESTRFVLTTLGRLRPRTVLVFDELVGYPGWPHHEHRALLEWVAATGTLLQPLAAEGEQASFIVTPRR